MDIFLVSNPVDTITFVFNFILFAIILIMQYTWMRLNPKRWMFEIPMFIAIVIQLVFYAVALLDDFAIIDLSNGQLRTLSAIRTAWLAISLIMTLWDRIHRRINTKKLKEELWKLDNH